MILDLSPVGLAWMVLAMLVAGFVRGYSGFGFSALVIAASSLVSNPLHFVAVVVIWETAMTGQILHGIGKDIDWRRVLSLMAGAAVGLPIGLWALTSIPDNWARAVISGYVLVMCLVLMRGWRIGHEVGTGAHVVAGVASGLANAPGMGGLPVAAFFAAQSMAPAVFRATLVAYFPLLDLYSAPIYWWHGMVTWDTLKISLIGLPLAIFANWLGSRHFLKTDPQDFRRFAILLLAGLAGLGLVKAVL